jgi:hypothetical protein
MDEIKEFKELLDSSEIEYTIDGSKITITGGYLSKIKDITSMPPNVEFTCERNVYLDQLKNIPDGTIFNNKGDVSLVNIESIGTNVEFKNDGRLMVHIGNIDNDIEFNNTGDIELTVEDIPTNGKFPIVSCNNKGDIFWRGTVKKIRPNIKFNNGGELNILRSNESKKITEIGYGVEFNNKANINFLNIESIDTDVIFNNEGDVDLSIESIDTNVTFSNNGKVILPKLTSITNEVTFTNKGKINITKIEKLPSGLKFNNTDAIALINIKDKNSINGVVFNNKNAVILNKDLNYLKFTMHEGKIPDIDPLKLITLIHKRNI